MVVKDLTPINFAVACETVAWMGGAVMIATEDKPHWLSEIKAHCTPCTTIYVRTPCKDSHSPVTIALVDKSIKRTYHVKKWLKRCADPVDYKTLKGWVDE